MLSGAKAGTGQMNVAILLSEAVLGAKLKAYRVCCIVHHWLKLTCNISQALVLWFKIQVDR